jgi:hypothetical protein
MKSLYCICPASQFEAAEFTRCKTEAEISIKLSGTTVLVNDKGRCSKQQFGNIELARAKYEELCYDLECEIEHNAAS